MDEIAIQQTIARYSEAVSRFDWDAALATFAPDAVWEIPVHGLSFSGHDEIRAAMLSFIASWDYAVQVAAIPVIEVDGDIATARTVIREIARPTGGDQIYEMVGAYVDRLARTPDGWRFTQRTVAARGQHFYRVSDQP